MEKRIADLAVALKGMAVICSEEARKSPDNSGDSRYFIGKSNAYLTVAEHLNFMLEAECKERESQEALTDA